MGLQPEFLKYIYSEDIYMLDEPEATDVIVEREEPVESIQVEKTPTIVEEPKPISYLGRNEKEILFLVNDPSSELLNQADLDLFMKIVEDGLKFTRNDIALANTAKQSLEQVLGELSHQFIISMGVDISKFYPEQEAYLVHDSGTEKVLISESLQALGNDVSKKVRFWKALKSMFNISKEN